MLLYALYYDDGENAFAVNRLFNDQAEFDEFVRTKPSEPISSWSFIGEFEIDERTNHLVQVKD